jgi:hypothetical protein
MASTDTSALSEIKQMRERIELNELRARDLEAQARILEARQRLYDAQAKLKARSVES